MITEMEINRMHLEVDEKHECCMFGCANLLREADHEEFDRLTADAELEWAYEPACCLSCNLEDAIQDLDERVTDLGVALEALRNHREQLQRGE